jgi:hypothetical protein
MARTTLICVISFVAGAILTAAPFLISAHFANADELARGEQTMGPGITTFVGLLFAPVGGIAGLLIGLWAYRRIQWKADFGSRQS